MDSRSLAGMVRFTAHGQVKQLFRDRQHGQLLGD